MFILFFTDKVKAAYTLIKRTRMRRFVAGLILGSQNEIKRVYTDREVTQMADIARNLKDCPPWSQHITSVASSSFHAARNNGDLVGMRTAIKDGVKVTASKVCIEALLAAATYVVDANPTIIVEALPSAFID